MFKDVKKLVAKELRVLAGKLDAGTSDVTESEAIDILKVIAHEPMSKEQACRYLNISRSKFDTLITKNKMPQGKKRLGFKELVWYKDELSDSLLILKNINNSNI